VQLAKREDAHWDLSMDGLMQIVPWTANNLPHIQIIPMVMCVSLVNKRVGRSLPSLAPRHQSILGQVSGALVNVQFICIHSPIYPIKIIYQNG